MWILVGQKFMAGMYRSRKCYPMKVVLLLKKTSEVILKQNVPFSYLPPIKALCSEIQAFLDLHC